MPGSLPWLRLARRAKLLATLTLVWLCVEGTVGVIAGFVAGSVALVAFGLGSAIAGLASVIVLWRFTGWRTASPTSDRTAQKWVAISFKVARSDPPKVKILNLIAFPFDQLP